MAPTWLRLPTLCPVCKHYHKNTSTVCAFCQQLFVTMPPGCAICGIPGFLTNALCAHCLKRVPAFDQVICGNAYCEPLRSLIHDFKYHSHLFLRGLFVQLMIKSLPAVPDLGCLVPVPMHPQRLKIRGFNHAAVLAKLLAKQLALPYDLHFCQKIRNTEPQASLNSAQRHSNLQQAFTAKPSSYPMITLIDDLVTTGSTVEELARVIKQQSPSCRVQVWCLARTIAP